MNIDIYTYAKGHGFSKNADFTIEYVASVQGSGAQQRTWAYMVRDYYHYDYTYANGWIRRRQSNA